MQPLDEKLFHKHHALILSATGDGVFGLDADGATFFANPAAERLTGYSAEEMHGKPSHALLHHSHADGAHYPREDCPIYAAFRDGKVHRVTDEVFWRKDGSSFPIEYVSTPLLDDGEIVGAVVTFRDVTEEKLAKDALRESEERYRKIVEATHDVILLMRARDGAIVDANAEACAMLGYTLEELRALSATDLHAHEVPAFQVFLDVIMANGRATADHLSLRASGGEQIPIRVSASLIQLDGVDCILAMAQDLRAVIEAEKHTRKLQADLLHGSRLSAMGEMASGLAHELNQPLTAVMNYLQASQIALGKDGAASEKATGYIDKAIEQAARAGKIIHGLRTFVQKADSNRQFEDLNQIVAEACQLLQYGAAAEDINFGFDLADQLPPVFVDKIQIQQVIFNLVRNAVEALADQDNGTLTVSTAMHDGQAVMVSVFDNGAGLDQDVADTLFQAFTTTKSDGMGVGLSICQSIVQDHGGSITANRNEGAGMTFRFTLPKDPEECRRD